MKKEQKSSIYSSILINRPLLRVGIMLDDLVVPAWIEKVIAEIKDSGFADIFLVILNATDDQVKVDQRIGRIRRILSGKANIGNALYYRYVEFDNKKHPQFISPFLSKELGELLENASKLLIKPHRTKFIDRFTEKDIEKVRGQNLDVLLRFGFNIIKGDILKSARYGVWSYHHGDNNHYRGGPALFWEMYDNNIVSGTVLQQLTEELDGGSIIYRSYSATDSDIWLSQNRSKTYWKTSAFILRCLRKIYLHGEVGLNVEALSTYKKPIFRTPTNNQMVKFLKKVVLRVVQNRIKEKLFKEQWFIAYRFKKPLNEVVPDALNFTPLYPPKDRIYADPFPFFYGGKDYIFFEDLDYKSNKGAISYVSFDENGLPTAVKQALSSDYHLSYPFIFEWNGHVYMIPETAQKNVVQLFRAVSFPDKWEFVENLLEGVNAVDATLLDHNGFWYMFVNISECGGSSCDELFLFTAKIPLGPFIPHPQNPIKSDARSARPAGGFLKSEGKLIRPSQDCTGTYGRAINFCEVTTLTLTEYEEHIIGRIDPTWSNGLTGTHTFNRSENIDVIDGKRMVVK